PPYFTRQTVHSREDTAGLRGDTLRPSAAEMRLSVATGGEASCWRCLLPFGAVTLVGGAMLTAIGFASLGSAFPRMGFFGALCWRLSQRRQKKEKRRESQTALVQQHAHSIA
uniref:Transmembrane protein 100 n=1 Tax=Neogobius melanostomus TaxID=47308 RepID=A0A8C6TD16_9GOBI